MLLLSLVCLSLLSFGLYLTSSLTCTEDSSSKATVDDFIARALDQQVRVLCWIPSVENQLRNKVKVVNETWVKRCNKHVFFIDTHDRTEHSDIVRLEVKEGKKILTEKSMVALAYLYEHYGQDFDWFLKGDDDAYIIVENLKFLLSHYDPSSPVYLGHLYKTHLPQGYMSGGASYAISREALRLFNEEGLKKNVCRLNGHEDVEVGRCLHSVGVPSYNSLDRFGRETFHPLDPATHIVGPIPASQIPQDRFRMVDGDECCSQLTISFHKLDPKLMRIFDHLLYKTSVYGRQLDMSALQQFVPAVIIPPVK